MSHSLDEGSQLVQLLAVDAVGHESVGKGELLGRGLAVMIPLVGHVEYVLQSGVLIKQLLVEGESYLVPVLLQERTADLEDPAGGAADVGSSQAARRTVCRFCWTS